MSTTSASSGTNVLVPIQMDWPSRWQLTLAMRELRRRFASRRELAALTKLDAKDLGYPAALEAEKCQPFWRS